jgi:hypothetical protein
MAIVPSLNHAPISVIKSTEVMLQKPSLARATFSIEKGRAEPDPFIYQPARGRPLLCLHRNIERVVAALHQ